MPTLYPASPGAQLHTLNVNEPYDDVTATTRYGRRNCWRASGVKRCGIATPVGLETE
jgi:hypothetical protein